MYAGTAHRKTKTITLCLTVLFILLFTSGCAAASKSLTYSDFSADTTRFAFPGLEWAMSADQAEKALGFSISAQSEGVKDKEGILHVFYEGKKLSFYGLEGNSSFQFKDDKLWAAGISIQFEEDGSQKFEEMLASAKEAYGAETEALVNKKTENPDLPAGLSSTGYTWERTDADGNTTRAMLSCSMRNDVVNHISFDVNQFNNKQ